MNVRKHDAEMTIEGFLNAFLTEKNVKKALSFLDEDIYWTEAMIAHEASGLREVAAGLDRLVESIPDNDGVVVRFEKGREVGSDLFELSGTSRLLFSSNTSNLMQVKRHIVFLCRRHAGKIRMSGRLFPYMCP